MERIASSPRNRARIAGAFYLISIAARIIADAVVRDRLVVSSDAAKTATNIMTHEALFRWGFVADIFAFATFLVVTALLYQLLKPVNRSVSLVAAFFSLVACTVQAVASAFHLAPFVLLSGSPYLRAFTTEQLQALALTSMKLRALIYHSAGLVFLGLWCILIGFLILRSQFMPRILGVLVALAGFAYLPFLSPPLARSLLPYILIPAGVGQIALTLWLLAAGVNAERWREQAAIRAQPTATP